MFAGILLDAAVDGLKILPLVFLAYLLIEYVENRETLRHRVTAAFSGRLAPALGAAVGSLPQCGLSVVAANLYRGKYILIGTLFAVYIATSDEAIPIILSHTATSPWLWKELGIMLAVKFVYALAVGYIINFFAVRIHSRRKITVISGGEIAENPKPSAENEAESQIATDFRGDHEHDDAHEHEHDNEHEHLTIGGHCHHGEDGKEGFYKLALHAFLHSLVIFVYIFAINLVLGVLINMVIGEDNFSAFLTASEFVQPVIAALVGLVPNCASSVVITELFASGVLTRGAFIAGLTANSGLGLAVLFKNKSKLYESLAITAAMFVFAVLIGYLMTALPI